RPNAGNAAHLSLAIRLELPDEHLEEVRLEPDVVINEGDEIAGRRDDAGVPLERGAASAADVAAVVAQVRHFAANDLLRLAVALGRAVHQDELPGSMRLALEVVQQLADLIGPPQRGGDHRYSILHGSSRWGEPLESGRHG